MTLVDHQRRLLPFVDAKIIEALECHLREKRIIIWPGECAPGLELVENGAGTLMNMHLGSGKEIVAEEVLYSIGRSGATSRLNLAAALTPEAPSRLKVDEHYQTAVRHIYAAGDVVDFPSLASTSME